MAFIRILLGSMRDSAIGQVVGGSAYFVHCHGWCALKVSQGGETC